MTRNLITQHLTENTSYFKWGNARLAKRYGVTEKTISNIVSKLSDVKSAYLRNLKN